MYPRVSAWKAPSSPDRPTWPAKYVYTTPVYRDNAEILFMVYWPAVTVGKSGATWR